MASFTIIESGNTPLKNGKLIDWNILESEVKKVCHYVKHVAFFLSDKQEVIAMIFPDRTEMAHPDYSKTPEEGCFCPRNLNELGKCLSGCTGVANIQLPVGHARINKAIILNTDLTIEEGTLTPAGSINVEGVLAKFGNHLANLYGAGLAVKEEACIMNLP